MQLTAHVESVALITPHRTGNGFPGSCRGLLMSEKGAPSSLPLMIVCVVLVTQGTRTDVNMRDIPSLLSLLVGDGHLSMRLCCWRKRILQQDGFRVTVENPSRSSSLSLELE